MPCNAEQNRAMLRIFKQTSNNRYILLTLLNITFETLKSILTSFWKGCEDLNGFINEEVMT